MTNNHMYVRTKTGVGPAPVIQNINSRLHTCNAQHQPSVRPANADGLHAEGHAGTDAARPVPSAQANTSWD